MDWERAVEHARAAARAAWDPVVRNEEGPSTASRFGGSPWLARGESWPQCGCCRRPLQHFLQINSVDLPAQEAGLFQPEPGPFEGLLQLFYCVSRGCPQDLDDWSGQGRDRVIRIVNPLGEGGARTAPAMFTAARIVGWTRFDDYPSDAEPPDDWSRGEWQEFCEEAERRGLPLCVRGGDKLGGYPRWIQGVWRPKCSDCERLMGMVFQIASHDNVPYSFGDGGIGRIFVCPAHSQRAAFCWDCS